MIAPFGGFSPTSRYSRPGVPSGRSKLRMPPPMPEATAKEMPEPTFRSAPKCSFVRMVVRGAKSLSPAAVSVGSRSGVMSSRIQKERPCVPATRSEPLSLRS